jgi:site-specific DNA-methyltransferase (adenine-specific)
MNAATQKVMFSSKKQDWATPQGFFDKLNWQFGPFNLDPCATPESAKCSKFFTEDDDGLTMDWGGHTVFVNPPYGRTVGNWVKKAFEESKKDNTTVVMLIAARPDTQYWHNYVMNADEVYFIKGRLKFGEASTPAPFPSAVVVFKNGNRQQIFGAMNR